MRELSFASRNASIYVLVNVVEKEICDDMDETCSGVKLFNTNLVFDRNGCIVSRYRKFNLFVEPFMNTTITPDIATFETDFGVTFGHFICFDLLFQSPAIDLIERNITHILYPSMWFSETPFLTSVQIQQAFAQRHNIVLLSSGTNSPSNSNTGSGIFVGRHGAVDKIISFRNETLMMIAEIPKDVDDTDYEPGNPSVEPYTPEEMNGLVLWNYDPITTYRLEKHFKSEIDNVSCEFTLNFTRNSNSGDDELFGYSFTVFSGVRSYAGIVNGGEIHCAIIPCADETNENCDHKLQGRKIPSMHFHSISVKLTIAGDDQNIYIMPTTLDTSILPLSAKKYSFEINVENGSKVYSMNSEQQLENLMTFGFYGRNFNLDSKEFHESQDDFISTKDRNIETAVQQEEDEDEEDEDKNYKMKMIIYVFLMIILSILTTIMTYRKLQTPYLKPDYNKRKSCSN